jgi:ribosomal protein S18 acetylase RimI-like enzyme
LAAPPKIATSIPGVTIRPARRADATHVAALTDIAGEGLPSAWWRRAVEPGQSPFELGRARAMREEGNFSIRNALIAEAEGEVAGLLLGYLLPDPYDMPDLATLSEAMKPLLRLEARVPGSWYLNILAVYPEFRRVGMGRMLLEVAVELARSAGVRVISLIAASENHRAVSVYTKAGFKILDRVPLVSLPEVKLSGEWLLMTRSV